MGKRIKYEIRQVLAGDRLDRVLSKLQDDVSRQYFQKLIKEKRVWLGGRYLKPSYCVKEGDILEVEFPEPVKMDLEPADIPLTVVYEDADILVLDKQAGLVVHPAEHGKFMGQSLVNAVLHHAGDSLRGIGGVLRPGIVHRLDKDTSGLIVVAKSEIAHHDLVNQFKTRTIKKRYMAFPPHLVWNQIEVSVARARKHGLTSDEDIISFVSVMHEISPNFDEEPTLKAILADTSKTPHERWQALFADTPALNAAWERAAAPTFYDYKAWIGPDDEN